MWFSFTHHGTIKVLISLFAVFVDELAAACVVTSTST